jgi:tetratricopeptide (TPR) repeat protein
MSTRNLLRPSRLVTVGLVASLLLGVGAVLGARQPAPTGPEGPGPAPVPVSQLETAIEQAQERLRRLPDDYLTWAELGLAYLEQSRITADPSFYAKAEGALERSLEVRPEDNPETLVGLAALANARHEFADGRRFARRAIELNRYDADAYGALADAETQLGHADAATTAVQAMLDLNPGVPALTRAAYDLEQHGRVGSARSMLERAVAAAVDPADIAYCRHQLGELAWHSGDLDEAEAQYRAGVAADPTYQPLRHGLARLAAARGDLPAALGGYAGLTAVSPTPGYLIEYAELLRTAGRDQDAAAQLVLAEASHELFLAGGGTDDLTGALLAIAQDHFEAAVELAEAEWHRRRFADVADTLAWALHLAGRDTDAIEYARRADTLGPRNAGYAFHRGMIELSLGNRSAARTQLTRALHLNPHFSPWYAPIAARTLADLEST